MAIADKRPADVLRWYEALIGQRKQPAPCDWEGHFDSDRVAKAIAAAYPQRALEMYRKKLDSQLIQTGVTAYENCVACLRAMRAIYKQLDRDDYWTELVADIRHKYRNRPRFMELLDRLAGRTIVATLKSSARR
jgi:uncharacterized Zn finger protein